MNNTNRSHMRVLQLNTPIILTLIRLILSPVLLPGLLVYFLPYNSLAINGILALVFVALSLTDFFDGYLARHYGKVTDWGRILDPIADKFLVYSTLIALVQVHKLYFYWAIVIIGREFFVMGLREIALFYGFSVHVSKLGKAKTVLQMLFLLIVILNPSQALGFQAPLWNGAELVLLVSTLTLTIVSGASYFHGFCSQLYQRT